MDGSPDNRRAGSPHQRACWADLVVHACGIAEDWLAAKQAELTPFVQASQIDAYEAAIAWFQEADHAGNTGKQKCVDHFWDEPVRLNAIDDWCSPPIGFFDQNGLFVATWQPSETWEGSFGAEIRSLSLSLAVEDMSVLEAPTSPLECGDPDDNNGLSPPFENTVTPGFEATLTTPTPGTVTGPALQGEVISGHATFSTTSTLTGSYTEGKLKIGDWRWVAQSPASVGTSQIEYEAQAYEIRLMTEIVATKDRGRFTIPQGRALFHMMASVDGLADGINAPTTEPIEIYRLAPGRECPSHTGCWQVRAFTIRYVDAFGDDWALDVPATIWAE